ncbi:3-deoxy-manno-octulosonate cytidylyltransferase [Flavobacteriaceae bacterium Ap0902]|nr:3-deoxy-manno-octulosonate cytidylyltransferase [Flavobacteriaceae bacterium Ap0902]
MNLNVIAVIPARFQASRFPGKLLMDLHGKSVILSTYQAAVNTGLFQEVIVAADDERIYNEIVEHGGQAVMTSSNHQSGSDRIAEVIENMPVDIVLNIQGDEPFLNKEDLQKLIYIFEKDLENQVHVATLVEELIPKEEVFNPNNVKVVLNNIQQALYFSRAPIPYNRDENKETTYYKHIGIYAFRKEVLMTFTKLPQGTLEQIEKLEQLRYLENGYTIKVARASGKTIGIDTQADLDRARELIKQMEQ